MDQAIEAAAMLPCPFCGGDAEYCKRHNTGAAADWCGQVQHWVGCFGECGAGTCMHDTEAEAIAAWNTRAAAPILMEQGARLALEAAAKVARDYAAKAKQRGWPLFPDSIEKAARHIATAIRALNPAEIVKGQSDE